MPENFEKHLTPEQQPEPEQISEPQEPVLEPRESQTETEEQKLKENYSEYNFLLDQWNDLEQRKNTLLGSPTLRFVEGSDERLLEIDKKRHKIHLKLEKLGKKLGRNRDDILIDIISRDDGTLKDYGLPELSILTSETGYIPKDKFFLIFDNKASESSDIDTRRGVHMMAMKDDKYRLSYECAKALVEELRGEFEERINGPYHDGRFTVRLGATFSKKDLEKVAATIRDNPKKFDWSSKFGEELETRRIEDLTDRDNLKLEKLDADFKGYLPMGDIAEIAKEFGGLDGLRGRRILDLGCGAEDSPDSPDFAPNFCRGLQILGAEPVGVDIAKGVKKEKFENYVMDLSEMGVLGRFPDGSFDAVRIAQFWDSPTLEAEVSHRKIQQIKKEIESQAKRLLKPGGIYVGDDYKIVFRKKLSDEEKQE